MSIITSVEKDGDAFVINKAVKVQYNIEDDIEECTMDIEYDDALLTEQEAQELAQYLLQESLNNIEIPND